MDYIKLNNGKKIKKVQEFDDEIEEPSKEEYRGKRNPNKKKRDRDRKDDKFDDSHWN